MQQKSVFLNTPPTGYLDREARVRSQGWSAGSVLSLPAEKIVAVPGGPLQALKLACSALLLRFSVRASANASTPCGSATLRLPEQNSAQPASTRTAAVPRRRQRPAEPAAPAVLCWREGPVAAGARA
jgi:hypothetical protein